MSGKPAGGTVCRMSGKPYVIMLCGINDGIMIIIIHLLIIHYGINMEY